VTRNRILTALTACAVVAAVVAAGWTAQAALLPAPARGAVVATQAMSWLETGRTAASAFTLGGSRTVSRCRGRTLRFADGNVEQTVELVTDAATRVYPLSYPFRDASGRRVGRPSGIALTRLQLAGCPAALEALIGSVLKHRDRAPALGDARFAGRDALTLRIWTPSGTMTVFLDAGDKRPLGLALAGRRVSGRARLRWEAGAA
jgi:hypothetical protein